MFNEIPDDVMDDTDLAGIVVDVDGEQQPGGAGAGAGAAGDTDMKDA